MEKRLIRIEIVLIITLFVSIANLFLTQFHGNTDEQTEEITEIKALPSDISREFLDKTVYKVKTDFNNSKWIEMFDVFGPFAKAQLSPESVGLEFKKIKPATGEIQTYAYSHHTHEGSGDGAEWFKVYYKCRFENARGTIKISIRTANNKSEICGVNIVLDSF